MSRLFNRVYYTVKPLLPRALVLAARRAWARRRLAVSSDVWPVHPRSAAPPPSWPGWPQGKRFAFVLTHDVEGPSGLDRIPGLTALEDRYQLRSSINFIPEDAYSLSEELRLDLRRRGFEIGVHGLEHDGKLYFSRSSFARKAARIRHYLQSWGASGFRSPLMHHNLGWLHLLGAAYDASTFDTDPFEPEPDGVASIFPFWVPGPDGAGFVELPYTLPQDHTLFSVLGHNTIDVWKQKLDWIAAHGGMALLNTHPDYFAFDGPPRRGEAPIALYEEFLAYARQRYSDQAWFALPSEVASWYTATLPPAVRNSRKRVCMVTYSNYAGDNRVRRYAETLAARGDLVDVLSLEIGGAPLGEDELNGVRVIRIQRRAHDERAMSAYAFRLIRFLFAAGRLLSRRYSEYRYDLIHVHNIPDFLVFSALRPKLSGAKVILDIHDIVPELFADKFKTRLRPLLVAGLKLIEKASTRFADHVIVANHIWHQRLIERSVPASRCSVVLNYVDPTIFHRRARTRASGPFTLLFHGTFQWHQGLDIAIRALALVRQHVPDVELHLYGGGGGASATTELQQLAGSLNLNGSVRFLGRVPLHQIPQIIADSDLGIVPKRADSFGNEACSTKIMEFMSQGVPVVVSKTRIDTYYHDSSNVRFFPSGDHVAMAEAILDVIRDAPLRQSLSDAGLDYAEKNSWDVHRHTYLNLVDSLTTETFESEARQ